MQEILRARIVQSEAATQRLIQIEESERAVLYEEFLKLKSLKESVLEYKSLLNKKNEMQRILATTKIMDPNLKCEVDKFKWKYDRLKSSLTEQRDNMQLGNVVVDPNALLVALEMANTKLASEPRELLPVETVEPFDSEPIRRLELKLDEIYSRLTDAFIEEQ